ncbi:hypothetical protein RR46_13030 [Papilio xuthus]|uniref:Uncharacterized protein n=1 Tax=Papilio xuthus TaxID=66420 RepID=A0A194PRV2_PAPXU|nr:hypothetical protein RR46_13030 [Papilio xuthus]
MRVNSKLVGARTRCLSECYAAAPRRRAGEGHDCLNGCVTSPAAGGATACSARRGGCGRATTSECESEYETRGQSSDTGVARHDGITTGRCAANVRLNSGLNLRPARPSRAALTLLLAPFALILCESPASSSGISEVIASLNIHTPHIEQ